MDDNCTGLKDVASGNVAGRRHVNHEMNLAWQYIADTNVSVFLTGKAGTGKTTFLRKLRELMPKRMVVLAPTGVAAINAGGQTIHSFFQLPFGPMLPDGQRRSGQSRYKMSQEKKNLIKTLDLLVIDEISMVRCDLLDAIDMEMRKYRDRYRPFGGAQLLLIGDLQQLSPVATDTEWALLEPYYDTPYFFGAKALNQLDYVTVELHHIYRQQDTEFINLLSQIRSGHIDDGSMRLLAGRHIPHFMPPAHEDWIRLTTHNRTAQQYNEMMLRNLPADEHTFQATIGGNFPETTYPADYELTIKVGAQVMFIKNDPSGSGAYYNGKIGTVEEIEWSEDRGHTVILVHCKEDDSEVVLSPVIWENVKYVIDAESKQIREEVEGTFRQYPLRLAWAITVHKSQGLTFDRAVLDINAAFTHGQVYVALSRCRTLQGVVLTQPLHPDSIITDVSVNKYMDDEICESQRKIQLLPQKKHDYFYSLLDELMDFNPLIMAFDYFTRVVDEHLYTTSPQLLAVLKAAQPRLVSELRDVAQRFARQYYGIGQNTADPAQCDVLQNRLNDAFRYFHRTLTDIVTPMSDEVAISISNKQVSQQYNNALDAFRLQLKLKLRTLSLLMELPDGFTVHNYLDAKAKATLNDIEPQKKQRRKTAQTVTRKKQADTKPEPKPKTKPDTRQLSYNLYKQGYSIKEIAQERGLKPATIETHLATFVASGDIDIDSVVSPDHQQLITSVINQFTTAYTLSDIKEQLPQDYTYAEIKFVMASMG